MATETRAFARVTSTVQPQIIFEDLGYSGNAQDQFVIPTSGISGFTLTINDDARTNGGDYAAAFIVNVSSQTAAPITFAYVDFTNFSFVPAAQELAQYYSSLGYVVYDEKSFLSAKINVSPGEQITLSVSGNLYDNAGQQFGGQPHPISYTVQVTDPVAQSGGLNYGTDFRDVNAFSALGSFFDGRGDLDTVTFLNSSSNYVISVSGADSARVNGIDLINTERLDFANGTLALDTDASGTAGQVYRLYQAAFDRQPDTAGLSYNVDVVDVGMNIRSLSQYFTTSNEFQSLYGPNSSNATFTNALYENVLGRSADAAGYAYWNAQLNSGVSRGEMLLGFSESAENVALVGPQIENGIWLA